jgi:CDP-glucose 4,6-dehydratase
MNLGEFYKNKKVFVTGHSGFKGSWLCFFLNNLGAETYGYSLEPDNSYQPLYYLFNTNEDCSFDSKDIRDFDNLNVSIKEFNPDIVFHLAAQPLVIKSYENPIDTFSTNIMGTSNLLEICKSSESIKAVINITSDKCYENKNSIKLYTENDRLGGSDPYSASKACAEIINSSYQKSFYNNNKIGLASARAGNVLGGGDFSENRLIPDIIRSLVGKNKLIVRSPKSTRPWQHVFDVIYGYIILGKKLYENPREFSCSYNFSPNVENCITVEEILFKINNLLKIDYSIKPGKFYEANLLMLDAEKAKKELNWHPIYDIDNTLKKSVEWYNDFMQNKNIVKKSLSQYSEYMELQNE